MKFEQLLQVYWSKGFYFAGRMRSFNTTIDELFNDLNGLGFYSKFFFIKRFEFGFFKYKKNKNLSQLSLDQKRVLNMYIAKIGNVNYDISTLLRYNLIRLYLIKTFRGRAQSLGKPSRGQRTWSNAWTAYKTASPLKNFINEMKKIHNKVKVVESKNKKILKKKTKINQNNRIVKEKIKKNTWF